MNIKKYRIIYIGICILLSIVFISTTIEFSLYRLLSFRMFNDLAVENPYISSKCYTNLGVFENLGAEEKAMFNLLFNIPEVKKEQTCLEFIKSDYSLTGYLTLSVYESSDNNFEKIMTLLLFIITHKTSVTDNAYGLSYKCKDTDVGEKVCEIFNNDDSIEELYFRRIGLKWLLMKIEQKSL